MASFTSTRVQVPWFSQGKTPAQTTELQSDLNSFFSPGLPFVFKRTNEKL